ncbi:MAG: hypothetical protein ABI906_08355, partial [Pseudomonadota bacterium]
MGDFHRSAPSRPGSPLRYTTRGAKLKRDPTPPSAPPVWLIAGPTGSGKSALALRMAEAVGG